MSNTLHQISCKSGLATASCRGRARSHSRHLKETLGVGVSGTILLSPIAHVGRSACSSKQIQRTRSALAATFAIARRTDYDTRWIGLCWVCPVLCALVGADPVQKAVSVEMLPAPHEIHADWMGSGTSFTSSEASSLVPRSYAVLFLLCNDLLSDRFDSF